MLIILKKIQTFLNEATLLSIFLIHHDFVQKNLCQHIVKLLREVSTGREAQFSVPSTAEIR